MTPLNYHLLIPTESGVCCLPLADGTCWTIGRGKANAVILVDPGVSRHHAVLQHLDTGDFCISDSGSTNGSFVNGQRVTTPVNLRDGDRLTFGSTELEFRCAPVMAAPTDSACRQKTVLMIQSSECQGEIWYAALTSQKLSVIWKSADTNLAQMIAQIKAAGQSLPDLLLVDIAEIVEHDQNPYAFCRWCHQHYSDLKIILTCGTRMQISPAERKWAIYQGAEDLLPGFQQETLVAGMAATASGVNRVLDVLGWEPLETGSLQSVLRSLHRLTKLVEA